MAEPEPIRLDPSLVLDATRARHRQQMAAASQREADLLEEIASLEAYATTLRTQLEQLQSAPDTPGPWGKNDDDHHHPNERTT